MLEKSIEAWLRDRIRMLGGEMYKFVSPGNAGVPDRICVLPNGSTIFVELKIDTGSLSAIQKVQIKKLKKMNARVEVVYGMVGARKFMKEIEEELK